ncbi:MAG: sulfatase, partial [Phycisphaerae bacterium]
TMDTTRADIFGCYGGESDVTPNLDRLASEGALFVNAYSQSNNTNPSHFSIMSGQYLLEHRVFVNTVKAPLRIETLPIVFEKAGYHTGAMIAARHLYDLGWNGFINARSLVDARTRKLKAVAGEVTTSATTWLENRPDVPFFLWVHYFDPHTPYQPPQRMMARFGTLKGDAAKGARTLWRTFLRPPSGLSSVQTDPKWIKWLRTQAMYAGEVHYMDREIWRLLAGLKKHGEPNQTVIIAVADHGESMGEHGVMADHAGLYEPSIRIPFIIRVPGFPSGVKRRERVTQLDIAPTVLELFGLEFVRPLPGLSLLRLLAGESDANVTERRTLITESAQNRHLVVRREQWKLIVPTAKNNHKLKPPLSNVVELYDLDRDPYELRNVAAANLELVDELESLAERWKAIGLVHKPPARSKAAQEKLRRLGYME